MQIGEAKRITGGGFGKPSKMPGTNYGLPAKACHVGAKLAQVEGSVCHGCYALKGNYLYPSVQIAQARRLASITDPQWVEAMVTLLNKEYEKACLEFMELTRKPEKLVSFIRQSPSTYITYQSQTAAVGCGLDHTIQTDMDTTQRQGEPSLGTYQLTLPLSGAVVELFQRDISFTTDAEIKHVLIQSIWNLSKALDTNGCTIANAQDAFQQAGLKLTCFFRLHDSGDIQSLEHLENICHVARQTPYIQHWLPTREITIVKAYAVIFGDMPSNLCVRVSATMIDGKATKVWDITSGVHTEPTDAWMRVCPAPTQGNKCGDCRACWDKSVSHVSYHKH